TGRHRVNIQRHLLSISQATQPPTADRMDQQPQRNEEGAFAIKYCDNKQQHRPFPGQPEDHDNQEEIEDGDADDIPDVQLIANQQREQALEQQKVDYSAGLPIDTGPNEIRQIPRYGKQEDIEQLIGGFIARERIA